MLPPYLTAPEDLEPFGVQVMLQHGMCGNIMLRLHMQEACSSRHRLQRYIDSQVGTIIMTPLGLKGTVMGAR